MLELPRETGLTARRLTPGDARDTADAQAVADACEAYYRLVYGEPASKDEGAHLLTEVPPALALEDKLTFGLYTPRPRVCGLLTLFRGHRAPGEWYLGDLLLEPAARGQGRGAAVVSAARELIAKQGGLLLRIAVAEQNVRALHFWKAQGFEVEKVHPPRRTGARDTVFIELVTGPSPSGRGSG